MSLQHPGTFHMPSPPQAPFFEEMFWLAFATTRNSRVNLHLAAENALFWPPALPGGSVDHSIIRVCSRFFSLYETSLITVVVGINVRLFQQLNTSPLWRHSPPSISSYGGAAARKPPFLPSFLACMPSLNAYDKFLTICRRKSFISSTLHPPTARFL